MAGDDGARVLKLRFPEFVDHPLQALRLGDATAESKERNGGGQASLEIMGVSKIEGIVPMEERIIAVDTARYKFVRTNWFAYNPMRLNIGSIARWQGNDDILVSPDYVVFKCKSSGPYRLNPAYLDHFRRSHAWEDFVTEKGDGSVRVRIYYKDLARLKLALPSFPEQQKIADCLDSADALIAAQRRKVEALKAHKKGLMQQLFPEEGETLPRLRFPEFDGAGQWKVVPLDKFIEDYRGKSTVQDEYEVMTSARSGLVRQRDYYDNDRITERNNIGFSIIPPNYLTYRSRSDDRKFYFNENTLSETGIVSVYYPVFRVLNGSNKFFIELFSAFSRLIGTYSVGTSQTVLSLNQLKKIKLPVPSEAEQRRIGDCLASLDEVISAETQKLDTLGTHKRGLMQQLFPRFGERDA